MILIAEDKHIKIRILLAYFMAEIGNVFFCSLVHLEISIVYSAAHDEEHTQIGARQKRSDSIGNS